MDPKRRKVETLPPTQPQSVIASGIPMIAKAKPATVPADPNVQNTAATEKMVDAMDEELKLPSEKELGMTAWLDSARPGFVAIFKQRFLFSL